jgi:hypothetical protein
MDKEETKKAIRNKCIDMGLDLTSQIAYVLATVDWETGHTFQPVKEAFWCSEEWRKDHLRYYPYYGRGYVQLTWKDNYRKYGEKLDIDLVDNPDLALEPETAMFVLIDGFKTGAFTGKKLADFVNEDETDYYNARTCINGHDKAETIAAMAERYQEQLESEV